MFIEVGVLELIGHHGPGAGVHSPGGIVVGCQLCLDGLGAVPGDNVALFIKHSACALGCKDVVEGVVAAVANGEVILPRVEDVASGFGAVGPVDRVFVIGGKVVVRHRDGYCLTLSGGQLSRLLEADELHGGLLHLSRLPGRLGI